jgi:hypothetical protein
MSAGERDSTQDWLVPEPDQAGAPPIAGQGAEAPAADSPGRGSAGIDDRLAAVAASADAAGDLAMALEAGFGEICESSLEAASQAHAAAAVAERAGAAASAAQRRADEAAGRVEAALALLDAREQTAPREAPAGVASRYERGSLRSFDARAERVAQRLRELELRHLSQPTG